MGTILVVADGSRRCEAAVRQAIDLVRRGEARSVELLNVQPKIDGYARRFVSRRTLGSFQADRAHDELRAPRKILEEAGVDYRMHMRLGGVVDCVLDAAAELGVEGIVLGAEGRTLPGIFDFYTVAAPIIRRATVPVSVVKGVGRPSMFGRPAAHWRFRPSA